MKSVLLMMMVSACNIFLIFQFVPSPEPFRVGFDQTMYTVVESAGSVEVCVNLTHPPDDILGVEVTVLVFHNDSSVYVPADPAFASKELYLTLGAHAQRGLQCLICVCVRSICLSVCLSVSSTVESQAFMRPTRSTNGFSVTWRVK